MVVGWSDFAISSHIDTESGEPDGVAAGQTRNSTHKRTPRAGSPTASPTGRRATQRSKVSIFNAVRLPFCAARLIPRHGRCYGNPHPDQFECAAEGIWAFAD